MSKIEANLPSTISTLEIIAIFFYHIMESVQTFSDVNTANSFQRLRPMVIRLATHTSFTRRIGRRQLSATRRGTQ